MNLPSFNHALDMVFQWVCQATLSATVLMALVLLVRLLFRRALPPRWQYALGLLVLLRLALPFAPQSSVSVFNLANRFASPPPESVATISSDVPRSAGPAPMLETPISVPSMESSITLPSAMAPLPATTLSPARADTLNLSFIRSIAEYLWLAGCLAILAIIVRRHRKFTAQLRRWGAVREPRVLELLKECQARLGIRHPITVLAADSLNTPALFGVFKPRLLIPAEMLGRLDDQEWRHIFLHEIVHLRHCDVLINYAMLLLRALHWFNPFVWLAMRRLRADQELACDAAVINRLAASEQLSYGSTLIKLLADFPAPDPRYSPAVVPFITHKQAIKRRIQMIAHFKAPSPLALAASLALTIALACVTFTRAADNSGAAGLPTATRRDTATPMASSNLQSSDDTGNSLQPSASAVTVMVAADGTATVRGFPQLFDKEQLQDFLRTAAEINPQVRLNIQGTPVGNVKYEDLAWVVELANKLKITNLTLHIAAPNNRSRGDPPAAESFRTDGLPDWPLQKELADLNDKIAAQEAALSQNTGSTPSNEASFQTNPTVIETEKDLIAEQALLTQLTQLSSADLRQVLPTTVPDALLTQSLQDLNAAQAKYAALQVNTGQRNPDLVATAASVAKLNSQVDDRVKGILRGLQTQIATDQEVIETLKSQSEEAEQRSQYNQFIQAKAQLDRLKSAKEEVVAKLADIQKARAQNDAQAESSSAVIPIESITALKNEVAKYDKQIRQAETNLAEIRRNLSSGERSVMSPATQLQANSQLIELKGSAAEMETTLSHLRNLSAEELPKALATFFPESAMQELLNNLAAAKSKLAELSVNLGTNHPDMKTVQNLITATSDQIAARANGILAALQTKLDATRAQIKEEEDDLEVAKAEAGKKDKQLLDYHRAQDNLEQLRTIRKVLATRLEQVTTNSAIPADAATPR